MGDDGAPSTNSCSAHRFIQMSGMTLGGMIEADRRLREYEGLVRRRKRVQRDQLVWRKWEGLVEGGEAGGSAGGGRAGGVPDLGSEEGGGGRRGGEVVRKEEGVWGGGGESGGGRRVR